MGRETRAYGASIGLRPVALNWAGVARRTLESPKGGCSIHLDDLLEKIEDTSASEVIAALFELEMQAGETVAGKEFLLRSGSAIGLVR